MTCGVEGGRASPCVMVALQLRCKLACVCVLFGLVHSMCVVASVILEQCVGREQQQLRVRVVPIGSDCADGSSELESYGNEADWPHPVNHQRVVELAVA